jgi:hypothetical protein
LGTGLLSTGLAVASLLVAHPALGQNLPIADANHQLLSSTHPHRSEAVNEDRASALTQRTALFNPELDQMLATILLWTMYLGLPIGLIVAIRYHDRRVHQQMFKLVEQVAILERIWRSQVH